MAQTEIHQRNATKLAFSSEESGNLGQTETTTVVERQRTVEIYEGKTVVHYILNPGELHTDHPRWHYAYLALLTLATFVALFIGPVVFGMLATFGGIGAPILLSIVGGIVGTFAGLMFGVVFAVVCIVGLVKGVGWVANEILKIFMVGGVDLMVYAKESARKFGNPSEIQHY